MTMFEQLQVVQQACWRVKEALNKELKSKGTVLVTVMDDPLLHAMGNSRKMITSGTGDYYADIKVFDGNAWINYLIAGNSPKNAVINAMNYAFDNHSTDAVMRERIDKFRIHVNNYLSQRATVIKQTGILTEYRVVFQCDLEWLN